MLKRAPKLLSHVMNDLDTSLIDLAETAFD